MAGGKPVAPPESFDLEAYISNYTSHTKIDRLLYIADRCRGHPVELQALQLAADEISKTIRNTYNTTKYTQVMDRIGNRIPYYDLNGALVQEVEVAAEQRHEMLEQNILASRQNTIRESARIGYTDLGDFYYHRGELQNAFKTYVRTRDYTSSSKHIILLCLNVIKVAIEMKNFIHVQNYVAKAEQTPDAAADTLTAAKLKCVSGLALLGQNKYKAAAKAFVEVDPGLGNTYGEVIAPGDVALYGGLAALASFDRGELKQRVMDNIGFREYLGLHPEVRDVIHHFHHSRYAACLAALEALAPSLQLDLHLAPHAAALVASIRTKALVQYTSPFSCVALPAMATAFGTSLAALEKELAALIMERQIAARIDSQAKVLYARTSDARAATFADLVGWGERYVAESKALLLRAALIKHDMVQTSGKEGKEERGERRGHHGGGGGMHGGRGRRGGGGDREDRDHAMWLNPAVLGSLAGGSGAGPSGL